MKTLHSTALWVCVSECVYVCVCMCVSVRDGGLMSDTCVPPLSQSKQCCRLQSVLRIIKVNNMQHRFSPSHVSPLHFTGMPVQLRPHLWSHTAARITRAFQDVVNPPIPYLSEYQRCRCAQLAQMITKEHIRWGASKESLRGIIKRNLPSVQWLD